jgi:hypothetical protein
VTILTPARPDQRSFLLQRAQPAMNGLIDGSLSTLAPIFTVAFATHQSHYAFFAGLGQRGCGDRGDVALVDRRGRGRAARN